MCTVLLKFLQVSKIYRTKSCPSINKRANIYCMKNQLWSLLDWVLATQKTPAYNMCTYCGKYGNLIQGLFWSNVWAISGQQFDIRVQVYDYQIQSWQLLHFVHCVSWLYGNNLEISMLEASTRARTGDSAVTNKLFENTFFFQMNRTHNTKGMVNLKQKQFALSRVTILKLQKEMHDV